jgi:hypothetical protein
VSDQIPANQHLRNLMMAVNARSSMVNHQLAEPMILGFRPGCIETKLRICDAELAALGEAIADLRVEIWQSEERAQAWDKAYEAEQAKVVDLDSRRNAA